MANKLDWLEVEIRTAHDAAVAIHNELWRERYQSWLAAIAEYKEQSTCDYWECGKWGFLYPERNIKCQDQTFPNRIRHCPLR